MATDYQVAKQDYEDGIRNYFFLLEDLEMAKGKVNSFHAMRTVQAKINSQARTNRLNEAEMISHSDIYKAEKKQKVNWDANNHNRQKIK